jgi:microcystin-dependent protein
MDAEHDDISTALSNTICRDGQSTTTARIAFASGVSAAAGSASSVAYAHANDPNTGLYFPASDQWGLVAGGTAVFTGTSAGVSVTGTQSVSGAATFSSTVAASGDITHHGHPIVPVGSSVEFWGTSAPNGWLFCYGQAISRSTYSALFTALGTTYGVGDGATTFNLPDARGRVVAGRDDMGGSSANRLTDQTGGLNGDTLGATGGAETHTLTAAQHAAHTHGITDPGHRHLTLADVDVTSTSPTGSNQAARARTGVGNAPDYSMQSTPTEATLARTSAAPTGITATDSQGSGTAHNNVQPTIIANKIIYTGVYS